MKQTIRDDDTPALAGIFRVAVLFAVRAQQPDTAYWHARQLAHTAKVLRRNAVARARREVLFDINGHHGRA